MFQKGISGNAAGRPKDTLKKSKDRLKGSLIKFIESNLEHLQGDFDKADPKKRLDLFEKMIGYTLSSLNTKDLNKLKGSFENIKRVI